MWWFFTLVKVTRLGFSQADLVGSSVGIVNRGGDGVTDAPLVPYALLQQQKLAVFSQYYPVILYVSEMRGGGGNLENMVPLRYTPGGFVGPF
jgi:hypothetical protein